MEADRLMNILVIAKAFPPETGGLETYSERVALAYAHAGHEVTVVTAHPGLIGPERRGDISVLNVGQGAQPVVFARMARALLSMRRRRFDFVHATSWRVALPAILLRRSLPLVITVHGREVFVVPAPLRPIMLRVIRRADLVPTVSQAVLDKFQESLSFPLDKAFPNWNGISFEAECLQPHDKPDGFTISCLCRMVERKNVAGAIRAVAALIREGHDIRFRVAGSGPELDRLRALVAEERMSDRIEILGRIPDEAIVPLYRESHVFLHPQIAARDGQDMEGFGLTIADAMSFGTVPVAGASGGPLDFIATDETGFLVDGTDQGAIVDALRRLVEDRGDLARIGRNAQSFACSRMTWGAHVGAILSRLADRPPSDDA